MCRWLKVLFVVPVAILSTLSACDSTEPSDDPRLTEQQSASGGETSATSGAAVDGEIPSEIQAILDAQSDTWPDYIPADIPPLPDNIRNVMGGSTHIRIFYHELSQGQIDEYLQLLQENGFHLQYVVYQDERYPDDEAAQKRIEEGDFDAVHITKGDYELQITYGGGETVMDISASGWEDANPFTPDRQWPADLADLPIPQDCRIEGVYPQDSGGYQIVCRPNDEEAAKDYYQALRAAGYLLTDSPRRALPPVAGDYQEVLSLGDTEITLEYSASVSTFRLTVWRLEPAASPTLPATTQSSAPTTTSSPAATTIHAPTTTSSATEVLTWPAELKGLVPQPDGAVLESVQHVTGLGFVITCHGRGDGLLEDYAQQLNAEGFRETLRIQADSGEIKQITLVREPVTVDLMQAISGTLIVRVTESETIGAE